MTSVARSTIAKAKFFLAQADEAGCIRRDDFCNHLEASIVFTRSVTFHLQKEFANCVGFSEWYTKHQKSLGLNQLGRFLLEQRNYLLKEGPITTHRVIEITMTASVHLSGSATITIKRGAPWYRRSPLILWEDATYPFREKLRVHRENRNQAKTRQQIGQNQPPDVTRDAIYFSNEEWETVPAIELVHRLLDELNIIVLEAEQKFLPLGCDGNEDAAA